MEKDKYVFKTQISFGISTYDSDVDPSQISADLQLTPTRMHKKGETWIGERTGYVSIRPSTVWAVVSEWTVCEEELVSHHIEYFKSILSSKMDILKQYKEDARFDVSFRIWIETNYGAFEIGLYEDDLAFFNSIANWIAFSLLTKDEIVE
jgi:hypothetical protein